MAEGQVPAQPATPPKAPIILNEPARPARTQRSGSLREAPAERAELPEASAEDRIAGMLKRPGEARPERRARDEQPDDDGEPQSPPERRESPAVQEEREGAQQPAQEPQQEEQKDDLPDSLDDTPEPKAEGEEEDWEDTEYTAPNGKKYTVPKPLVDGALMQADYTKKSELVAVEKQYNVKLKQTLEIDQAIQSELAPAIGELQRLDAEVKRLTLLKFEPSTTVPDYIEIDKQLSRLTDTQRQYQGAVEKRSTELNAQKQSAVAALQSVADKFLSKALPKWNPAVKQQVEKHLQDSGYLPEEISQMYDPRLIHLAHDAALLKKIQSRRNATVKQVQQAAPVVRPQGRANNATTEAQTVGRLKVHAQRTGKPADAEAALTRMLKNSRGRSR